MSASAYLDENAPLMSLMWAHLQNWATSKRQKERNTKCNKEGKQVGWWWRQNSKYCTKIRSRLRILLLNFEWDPDWTWTRFHHAIKTYTRLTEIITCNKKNKISWIKNLLSIFLSREELWLAITIHSYYYWRKWNCKRQILL